MGNLRKNKLESCVIRSRLWLVALLIFVSCPSIGSSAQEKKWLDYEPAVVELAGKLVVEHKYGPPNYGENPKTDQKVRVPILTLSEPINVRGDPKSQINDSMSVEGATRIQLVFVVGGPDWKQSIEKKVRVKGTLFHAITGHHYTAVLVEVQEIQKQSKK